MSRIKVNIEKSWNGRYYTIKIPTSDISFDAYQEIGKNLTQSQIEYELEQGNKIDDRIIKYPNDVTYCYYDKDKGYACFSSLSMENIHNWLRLYDNIIYNTLN